MLEIAFGIVGCLLAVGGALGVFAHLDVNPRYGFAPEPCRNCFVLCLVGFVILLIVK